VRAMARDLLHPELAEHGEIGGGHSRGNNVTYAKRGTSESYTISRLKRDGPGSLGVSHTQVRRLLSLEGGTCVSGCMGGVACSEGASREDADG
jgi:hypothetical protein